jgi:hypothetical protein
MRSDGSVIVAHCTQVDGSVQGLVFLVLLPVLGRLNQLDGLGLLKLLLSFTLRVSLDRVDISLPNISCSTVFFLSKYIGVDGVVYSREVINKALD